jgi:hypothetical protein
VSFEDDVRDADYRRDPEAPRRRRGPKTPRLPEAGRNSEGRNRGQDQGTELQSRGKPSSTAR